MTYEIGGFGEGSDTTCAVAACEPRLALCARDPYPSALMTSGDNGAPTNSL